MTNQDHYSEKLTIITSIADDKILIPAGIPVNVYLQEAENLYNWCQPDKERLVAQGLQWQIVEDMPARIDALREAQARWAASDSTDVETEKEWEEKSPAAHLLRQNLVRSLKFAFSNNRAAVAKISKLGDKSSNAAMIQALRDISVFGKEHIDLLKHTSFDMTMLDTAAAMSREMASLLGAINSRRAFCSDSLKIRNQAYTYLKEAVTELKRHAAFVLWKDSARLKGYASDYYRKQYTKRKNQKEAEAVKA